jgi:hypothetical protein
VYTAAQHSSANTAAQTQQRKHGSANTTAVTATIHNAQLYQDAVVMHERLEPLLPLLLLLLLLLILYVRDVAHTYL